MSNETIDTSTIPGKIAVMQAYESGKKIETKDRQKDVWVHVSYPVWGWYTHDYRIKPEPKEVWIVSWTQLSTEHQAVYGSKDAAKRFIDDILRGTCAHTFKITKFIEVTE